MGNSIYSYTVFLSGLLFMNSAIGQEQQSAVNYTAEYFVRYQVSTALDMVNRVPGFTIDNGGDKRGFGGAAGNVLINDRRPSTKQDAPSAILARIPASLVTRVELIRTQLRDIDLQGHPEVVNVILDVDAPATVRWEFHTRQNLDHGPTVGISTSLADRWRDIDYNLGFDARHSRIGDPSVIETYNGNGELVEIRSDIDAFLQKGPNGNVYLNASSWAGDTFFQLNSKAGFVSTDLLQTVTRTPQAFGAESRQEIIKRENRNKNINIGVDAERVLHEDILGKAILLYSRLDRDPTSSQQDVSAAGEQTRLQYKDDETTSQEAIARIELYWAGLPDHAVQVDMEYAKNILDNTQVFTDDRGDGPVIIDLGGNVRVEEDRWNFLAQDTWSLGVFDINYGLGLERSTLSQSGDANQKRNFTFLTPRTSLTHSPTRGIQTRLRVEREVAQLDFDDFVSVAVFEDDNIIFGNPDLRPDSTWISELSHERRFENYSVIKFTAFHHWITDVLDLLPVSATDAVPGNIGDGRRWGLILETTQPLSSVGLTNAQITFRARWQDSEVTDPVTGLNRVLSGEGGFTGDILFRNNNKWAYRIDYRQDFEAERLSWGWGLGERAKRPVFKVNELDIFNEGYDLIAFIETSRWFGLNIRVDGHNLLNTVHKRDRTIFIGERTDTPVQRRELRNGTNGARLVLTVSGSF
jgi:hypothetical protein